jgi:hypothetical protein
VLPDLEERFYACVDLVLDIKVVAKFLVLNNSIKVLGRVPARSSLFWGTLAVKRHVYSDGFMNQHNLYILSELVLEEKV